MLSLVRDSVVWMSVVDSSIVVEISEKNFLHTWLKGYFSSCPSCRSEFLSVTPMGKFVSVYEKTLWKGKNGNRSQQSLGVCEINNGLIQNVWYFRAEQ